MRGPSRAAATHGDGGDDGGGALLELDETSALALADAGATLAAVEATLSPRGLWLGGYPVESRGRTVGAALAAPRPSEAAPGGRLLDRCAALHAVLPDGTAIETRLAPRKATGPDYAAALLGARGTTGRITAAWLRARRRAPMTSFVGWLVRDGAAALDGAVRVLATSATPTDVALLDPELAAAALPGAAEAVLPGGERAPRSTLALLRLDGAREVVLAEERLAAQQLGLPGAVPLAPRLVEDLLSRREPLALVERFVPAPRLRATFAARRAPMALLGLRHAGAALCAAEADLLPDEERPSPRVLSLHAALQQELERGPTSPDSSPTSSPSRGSGASPSRGEPEGA